MEIKELYHYMLNGTEEQNDQAIDVLSEIMYELQKKYPSYYAKYDKRLEEIYRHGSMSEEEAHEYVAAMKNKDGSVGEHWTLAQVQSYMGSHPEFLDINPVCFYVAMNMMYSDYYKPGRTTDTYAMLAKDFLTDKDAPADKLKRYIEAMHK
jgi:polyhydroxyalkanoate synthesis regulator phasin